MMSRVSVLVTHEDSDSDSAQHLNLPCVDSFNPTSLDAIAEGIVEGLKCYGDLWDLLPDDIIFYSLTTPVPDIIITSSLREYLQNLDLRSSAATLFRSWSIPQDRQLLAVCSFARRRIESPAIEQVATQHSVEQVIRSIRSRDTPSTEAKNAKLLAVQKREVPDAAYARRPLSLDGPPITIYSPVFSKFRHLAETVDLTAKEIGDTFDFVTASTEYYEDEQSRSEAIRYLLRTLVDGKFLEKGYINYGQRQAELDGFSTHVFGLLMAAKGIHEMNNGLGEGSSDALEQAICDFKAFCACNDGERLHARCCCPMFLVAIEGVYICVAGAVFTDRIIVERFTDYIFVGSSPQISGSNAIDEGIRRIGKILKALKICYQEHLPAFYDALPFPPSPASSRDGMLSPPSTDHPRWCCVRTVISETTCCTQIFKSSI
ncbi:Kinase domain protein [Mycena sanguinolenta]|uniref:Kinase domain protein n=1 Tax=Mycena sanguinolenta TaxID=230812 RepID=A0A8H6XZL7_9AGAR|nr:Kinase domain protein [Mycena sanguinolenta]